MDTWLAVASRREVREYADRDLPEDVVRRILDAGRLAGRCLAGCDPSTICLVTADSSGDLDNAKPRAEQPREAGAVADRTGAVCLPRLPSRGHGAGALQPRDGRGAARKRAVLLARPRSARRRATSRSCATSSGSIRSPSRTPSTSASGRRSTTTTTSSSSSSTARSRTTTASSRCTASTPSASSSPSTTTTAPAFAEIRRRYAKREKADRAAVAAALPDHRRARRQLLPDPRRLRRPDRRARGRDLPARPTTSSCRRSSR